MLELGNLLKFLFNIVFLMHSIFFQVVHSRTDQQSHSIAKTYLDWVEDDWIEIYAGFILEGHWLIFFTLLFVDWEFISSAIFIDVVSVAVAIHSLILPSSNSNTRLYYIFNLLQGWFLWNSVFFFFSTLVMFHFRLLIKSHVLIQESFGW